MDKKSPPPADSLPPGLGVGLIIGQLHRGGAETQMIKLATGLKERQVDVRVYCLSGVTRPHDATLADAGVPLVTLPRRGVGSLPRPFQLGRMLRRDGVRIAQSFLLGPSLQTALALLASRDILFIASNRISDLHRPAYRRLLESWALRRACRVTVNSTPALDYTRRYFRVPSRRIEVIFNGVEPLSPAPGERERARSQLGIPAGARVILGLFRLSPQKDLDMFCRVAEQSLKDMSDGFCLVAGDGPEGSWLRSRVAASPLGGRLRALGARDDVSALLAASDVMLLTSRFEGMPNGIMEAMSAGLPVVATRVGGLPDLVEDGVSGVLCPPGDLAGLVKACRDLLQDESRRVLMGRSGRARVQARFTVSRMVRAHLSLYARLLGQRTHPLSRHAR